MDHALVNNVTVDVAGTEEMGTPKSNYLSIVKKDM